MLTYCCFARVLAVLVSEESLQKSLALMSRSLKQLEIDVRNAQQDKSPPANDRFLSVMSISFHFNFKEKFTVSYSMHNVLTVSSVSAAFCHFGIIRY